VILVVVVFGIAWITGEPWFCKLCPAGTLEAGIPLTSLNADLREMTGLLFTVKLGILAAFIILFVLCKRPFCRTVCPLGAIYGLFNKVSILQPKVDYEKCIHCDACLRDCPVEIKAYEKNACQSTSCIRCYRCMKCPAGAVSISRKFIGD
jgi:polyferredoxin